MKQEALEVLKTRRSVRKFKREQVKEEDLQAVLEAGIYAPTGKNTQSPIIIAVQDPATIKTLSEMNAKVMGVNSDPYYGAPTILLILADRSVSTPVQDGCAVMTNLLNAAHAVGLGSCWVNREQQMFDSEEGKALLKAWGVEGDYLGVGGIALGYPAAELPEAAPRKEHYVYYVR